jgi:hypothetical protein
MGYWKNTGFLTETKYNNGLNQIPAPAKDWILDNYPYTSHGEFLSEGVYNAFIENKWEQRYSWIFHYRNEHIQHFYDDGSDDSIINLDTVLTEP